jgi:Transposase DDE domain
MFVNQTPLHEEVSAKYDPKKEHILVHAYNKNIDDRSPVMTLVKDISAKLIGDKGYISKKLSAELFNQNVTLIIKTEPPSALSHIFIHKSVCQ